MVKIYLCGNILVNMDGYTIPTNYESLIKLKNDELASHNIDSIDMLLISDSDKRQLFYADMFLNKLYKDNKIKNIDNLIPYILNEFYNFLVGSCLKDELKYINNIPIFINSKEILSKEFLDKYMLPYDVFVLPHIIYNLKEKRLLVKEEYEN